MAKAKSRNAEVATHLTQESNLDRIAVLTAPNKRIINLHISRPTFCLWMFVRVPLSSDWITLDEADNKAANAYYEKPNCHRHDHHVYPTPWSKDPDEEKCYANLRQRDAEKGPRVSEQAPKDRIWDSLRQIRLIDSTSCTES